MFDGIEYRGYQQTIVNTLATYAEFQYGMLNDEYHPTQILRLHDHH